MAAAMSPAQQKMAERAAALAAEQELRRKQNAEYQAQAQQARQVKQDAMAAQQAALRQQPVVDNRQLGGSSLTQTPLAERQAAVDAASSGGLYGSGLTYTPLAERQAAVDAAQGRPTSYYGDSLTMVPLAQRQAAIEQQQRDVFGFNRPPGAPQPTMPQRPPQMRRPPMAPMPGQRPVMQPRGPVAPQQQIAFQPQTGTPGFMPQQGGGSGIMQFAPLVAPLLPAATKGLGSLFSSFF